MTDMKTSKRPEEKILQELMGNDPAFLDAQERYEEANKIDKQRKEQLSGAMQTIARSSSGKILVRELERIVVASTYSEDVNRMYMLEGGRNTARYLLSLTRKDS